MRLTLVYVWVMLLNISRLQMPSLPPTFTGFAVYQLKINGIR